MTAAPRTLRHIAAATLLLAATAGVHAVTAESPTTRSKGVDTPTVKGAGRQFWQISDYTTVQLLPREPGGADNQHPWTVDPDVLKRQLESVQVVRGGSAKTLFGSGEVDTLLPTLVEVFAKARPDQDIAVVSAGRHDDNTFLGVTAVTARLFVADGRLNLIVRDAREDFYDKARGRGTAPSFTVGSRTTAGSADLRSASGRNTRPDWLVLSTEPVAAPPAMAAPAAPAAPVAASPAPAAPVAPAAAPSNDPEKRLEVLKRLYDKGLITSDEYQKKRQEILQGL
jgi:hypothetical protein